MEDPGKRPRVFLCHIGSHSIIAKIVCVKCCIYANLPYISTMNNAQHNNMSPATAAVYARIENMNVAFLQEMYEGIMTTVTVDASIVRSAIYRALEGKMGEDAAFDWVDSVEAKLYA